MPLDFSKLLYVPKAQQLDLLLSHQHKDELQKYKLSQLIHHGTQDIWIKGTTFVLCRDTFTNVCRIFATSIKDLEDGMRDIEINARVSPNATITFSFVPEEYSSILKNVLAKFGFNIEEERFRMIEIRNAQNLPLLELSKGCVRGDASIVPFICETYKTTLFSVPMRPYIAYVVQNFPSSVIYEDGKPIGYTFVHTHGPIGGSYVAERHRGKGISKKLMAHILLQLDEKGQYSSYGEVAETNSIPHHALNHFSGRILEYCYDLIGTLRRANL